jgi:hypothetical protein
MSLAAAAASATASRARAASPTFGAAGASPAPRASASHFGVRSSPLVVDPAPYETSVAPLAGASAAGLRRFLDEHPTARVFGRATFLSEPYRVRHQFVSRIQLVVEQFPLSYAMSACIAQRDRWQRMKWAVRPDDAEKVNELMELQEAYFADLTSNPEEAHSVCPATESFAMLTAVGGSPVWINGFVLPVGVPMLLLYDDTVSLLERVRGPPPAGYFYSPRHGDQPQTHYAAAWRVRFREQENSSAALGEKRPRNA